MRLMPHRRGKSTTLILECSVLQDKRDPYLLRKFWRQSKQDMIGELLFSNKKDIERVKSMLENMWRKRFTELKKRKINTRL